MFSQKSVKLLSALVGLALSAVLMAGCTPEEISNQIENAARSGAAGGVTPTVTVAAEKQQVAAQQTQKIEAQQKDDPANHDVNDDKGKDNSPSPAATTKRVNNTPAPTTGVSDDKGKDDPANHDVNDDKGKDDPSKHEVNDDRGKDKSPTPGVSDDKGKDKSPTPGASDDKGKDDKSGSGNNSGSGNSGGKGKK